jgi:hypothetical protein
VASYLDVKLPLLAAIRTLDEPGEDTLLVHGHPLCRCSTRLANMHRDKFFIGTLRHVIDLGVSLVSVSNATRCEQALRK